MVRLKGQFTQITKTIVLAFHDQVVRLTSEILIDPQNNGGEWNFICGVKDIENVHLNNSTVTCLSRNSDLVSLDNPQTSLWTVFIGTTFYQRNSSNLSNDRDIDATTLRINEKICFWLIWVFNKTQSLRPSDFNTHPLWAYIKLTSFSVSNCLTAEAPVTPALIWARCCSLRLVSHWGQAVKTNPKLSMRVCFMWECRCVSFSICAYVHGVYKLLRTLLISSDRPCFLFIFVYMQLRLSLSFLSPDNNFVI